MGLKLQSRVVASENFTFIYFVYLFPQGFSATKVAEECASKPSWCLTSIFA